ncbi:MAG: response regulator [Bacteroidia bacterium]|nr:response regulator [Bacteroidia bacterium]
MFNRVKQISRSGVIIISVIVYIAGVTAYSIWTYNNRKEEIEIQVDNKLTEAAKSIDYLLPVDYHDRAIGQDSITKIEFYEIMNLLSKQNDNLGVKYLYSVIQNNGKLYFTSSSATTEELLTGENLTYYWQEYTEADTAFYSSFNRNIPSFSEYTDRWGTFKTVLIPKVSRNGRKYVLCADMEVSFIRKQLMSEIPLTLAKALFLLLIVIPFLYALIKSYRRYSSDLESKVEQRTRIMEDEIKRRKISEEVLRQSEEKFSISFNRTPVPMFIIDEKGNIVDVNESFEEITGLRKNKIKGHYILSIPFFESAADYEFISNKTQINGSVQNYIMKYVRKNGLGSCSFSGELIKLNDKPNILAIVFDISERQKYENDLKLAKEKAEESDRLKSAFLANMSHEVRTPLNVIIGFSDLLRDHTLSQELRDEYIDMVTSNSRNLLELINDIIDISKIEAGQLRVSESACNLNQTLRQLYNWINKDKIEKNKNGLDVVVSTPLIDSDSFILIDEGRLKQIFVNLLTNALKFTNKGKIEFGYIVREKDLKFYVKDTGIGINKANLALIFERFKQADEGTARKYGGTGLGLAITKAITELMGGAIWVESEPDKGSIFYFSLPYKPLKKEEFKEESNDIQNNIQHDFSGNTFLIVEDDQASYYYLKTILERNKARIIHASNGLEAINAIKQNAEIELVLMDLHLPEMTGCKVTEEIRKIRPYMPVIAQTADAQAETREHAIACGFNDFVTKPISREILYKVIRDYLKK